jgi:vacuolar-type H+-ATPase subunit H
MAEKLISSIKEAEKAAKEIIEDRKKQNQIELEEAKFTAKNNIQSANADMQKSIKKAKNHADKDALEEIKILEDRYELEISSLKSIAKDNLQRAVKFIITRI